MSTLGSILPFDEEDEEIEIIDGDDENPIPEVGVTPIPDSEDFMDDSSTMSSDSSMPSISLPSSISLPIGPSTSGPSLPGILAGMSEPESPKIEKPKLVMTDKPSILANISQPVPGSRTPTKPSGSVVGSPVPTVGPPSTQVPAPATTPAGPSGTTAAATATGQAPAPSSTPLFKSPSVPKLPQKGVLPDEFKRAFPLSVQTLFLMPQSINRDNITPEIKAFVSSIGTDGPILKFSELFGPVIPPPVFIPRKKSKISHKVENIQLETDETQIFNSPVTISDIEEEEEIIEPEISVPTVPSNQSKLIAPLPTDPHLFDPVVQDAWEDRVIWDNNQISSKISRSYSQMLFTPGATPGPSATPEMFQRPSTETFFIPTSIAGVVPKKKEKKVMPIEPKPLPHKVRASLWGEIDESRPAESTEEDTSMTDNAEFEEVVSSSTTVVIPTVPIEAAKIPAPVVDTVSTATTAPASVAAAPGLEKSLFKHVNLDVISGDWMKSIIWDPDQEPEKPFPSELILDLNDPYLFPEDPTKPVITAAKLAEAAASKVAARSGRKRKEQELPLDEPVDKFNLSNDNFYRPSARNTKRSSMRKTLVLHSEPALKLTFVKPHLTDDDLANFHRPKVNFWPGTKFRIGPFRKEKAPKQKGNQQGPAKPIVVHRRDDNVMKTKADLSAREGRVVLLEFSEEHPLILSNFGMGTKVRNYYRKKNAVENPLLRFDDGENVLLDHQDESPFLGDIEPGKTVQSLDNNLYRAPIFKHPVPETDFLLIRDPNNPRRWTIRELPGLYTVGQVQPKMEVYAPNSRAANNYIKNRLQGYIYRLFMKKSVSHRLRISDIMNLFPGNSETSIRKRLKDCADFQRGGDDSGWWTVKDQSQLPSEEELRSLVTPEMVCLYESMLAGHYRLQQNGVRRHTNHSPAVSQAVQQMDDISHELSTGARYVEEELLQTPWNLSGNFVASMQGKGLLQLTGLGDPSGGRGEAFSYLRLPLKSNVPKKKDLMPKHQVTGTEADLRKLSLENARLVLLKFGVPESEIQKLGRWERIALVRKKSTEAAMSGEGNTKFARGMRYSSQEQQHQYKEQVQMIFDNQMKILSEQEPHFSDDEGPEDEEDFEDFGKDLESLLERRKNQRIAKEKEEEEDKEEWDALKEMLEDKDVNEVTGGSLQGLAPKQKVIRRTVTVTHPDGTQEKRVEIITDPKQIEEIIKKEEEKKRQRILQGVKPKKAAVPLTMEEMEQKERDRKERRRLQEQLRRLKKNKEKQEELKEKMKLRQQLKQQGIVHDEDEEDESTVKCSACGLVGHMKTNRCCPMYEGPADEIVTRPSRPEVPGITVKPELVKVEGNKIRLPKQAIEKPGLKIKIARDALPANVEKRLREEALENLALNRPRRKRRTTSRAQVKLNVKFEEIWKDLMSYENSLPFQKPVSTKIAPDYYQIIRNPMDLSRVKDRIKGHDYQNREELIEDIKLIVSNCRLYNGESSPYTQSAEILYKVFENSLGKRQQELEELEKAINQPSDQKSDGEEEQEDDGNVIEPEQNVKEYNPDTYFEEDEEIIIDS